MMLRIGLICLLLLMTGVAGCQATPPARSLELNEELLRDRQLQSRKYTGVDETILLSACAGVLQDLGFTLTETESRLGLIVAAKERLAANTGRQTVVTLLNLLADIDVAVDKEQQIRASLVTRPVKGEGRSFVVRVTFQRLVWDTHNAISRRESLADAQLYQRFFDQLSKSVFLEAHSI